MRLITGLFITLVLAAPPSVTAQGRGRGHQAESDVAVAVNVSIGRNDEHIIREWFSQPDNMRGLPPGLAKKEQLPPGLQKQLARNGQLPPGLQKKIQPLPPALEERLTPLPSGTKRFVLNGSVVLLDQHRNLILDIVAAF